MVRCVGCWVRIDVGVTYPGTTGMVDSGVFYYIDHASYVVETTWRRTCLNMLSSDNLNLV